MLIGYFIFQHERKLIERRKELAKLLGARFELVSTSLGGIPLEQIPILCANSNSSAKLLLSQNSRDFDSYHFLLSYSTPPGATRKHSPSNVAAVFKLNSVSLPKFSFGPSKRISRTFANVSKVDDEVLQVENNLIARYSKSMVAPGKLQQLLKITVPRELLPRGVHFRVDGQWLFAQSSEKGNFENWLRGTTSVVEQLLKNKE